MNDFKQKYEDFYYNFARAIIREQNLNRKKRLKVLFYELLITIGVALVVISWIVGLSANFSVRFAIITFFLAVPLLFTIFNILNPIKEQEAKLKYKFMDKFLEIFGTLDWHHGQSINDRKVHISDSAIFPKNYILTFDDNIYGWFNDKVEITINECKTERNSFLTILPIIIPTFILCLFFSIVIIIFADTIFLPNGKSVQLHWYHPFCLIISTCLLTTIILPLKLLWSSINRGNFQGIVLQCKLPKKFNGITYFYEKNPFTNKNIEQKNIKNLQSVEVEDIEFGKYYLIFSDDQIEARYILTSAFINRLNNIKTIFKSEYMRAEFRNNEMLLIIQTGQDMFTFNQFKKLSKSDFDIVFEELSSLFALIDELKLDVRTGL